MTKASQLAILIVDDMRSMRALVRSSLLQLGFDRVAEAEDGIEAMRKLESQTFHLVVSDLNMPNLDGLGLLKLIRETPALCNQSVIMLTSRGDTELVRQAIALKVNNYLMKPSRSTL